MNRWPHGRRCFRHLLIAIALQSVAVVDPSQAQNNYENSLDVDTNLLRTVILQHQSNHLLGSTIDLYADDSKPANVRYYTLFYIFPNWSKASNAWAGPWKSADGSKSTEIVVEVEVASDRVKQEIIQVERPPAGDPPFAQSNILVYPYNWLEIYVGANTFPDPHFAISGRTVILRRRRIRISVEPPEIRIPVSGTCSEIKHILEFYDISGRLVTATRQFKVELISAEMKDFTKSTEFTDMFSNATQSGAITITTSGHSSGAGLNLGGIFGGSTSNSGTQLRRLIFAHGQLLPTL